MKTKNHLHNLGLVFAGAALGASFLLVVQNSDESVIRSAEAAGGTVTGPNVEAPDRYVYYPGTEVLAKDEVRVIACGTGSMRNIASLMIPYEYLTKVFIKPSAYRSLGRPRFTLGGWLDFGAAGAVGGLGTKRSDT